MVTEVLKIHSKCYTRKRILWVFDCSQNPVKQEGLCLSILVFFIFVSWLSSISHKNSEEATSEFQKPSLSKWGQVHNLSCKNESYLHKNEKSFPYHLTSFWYKDPRNSEMAYWEHKYPPGKSQMSSKWTLRARELKGGFSRSLTRFIVFLLLSRLVPHQSPTPLPPPWIMG